MADIKIDGESAKKLFKFVEASREVSRGKEWRDRFDKDLQLLLGDHWTDDDTGLSRVVVNYTGMGVELKNASQTFQRPTFDATPYPFSEEAMANLMPPDDQKYFKRILPLVIAARIDQIFEESAAWRIAESVLMDKRVFGIGCSMVGWDAGEEGSMYGAEADRFLTDSALEGENPRDVTMPKTDMVGEGPAAIRISPYDLIIDPSVSFENWERSEFIGRCFAVEKERLVRDGRVKGAEDLTGIADFKGRSDEYALDPAMRNRPADEEHPFVLLVEVWFRSVWLEDGWSETIETDHPMTGEPLRRVVRHPKGYYPIVVTWAVDKPETPLRVRPWPYELRERNGRLLYPFDIMINRKVPGRLKGQSDCEIAQSQQEALNLSRSQEMTFGNVMSRTKFLAKKGALGSKAKSVFASAIVGDVAELEEGYVASDVMPLQTPAGKPEMELAGEHAMRDLNALTGVDEAAQGVAIQGAKTATEVNLINAKSGGRAAKEDAEFEDYLASVADKMWQLCYQFAKTGDIVNVMIPRSFDRTALADTDPNQPQEAPPSEMQVEIGVEHLLPAKIKVTTGGTKLRTQQQEIQGITESMTLLGQLGLLATPMNPQGFVNSRELVERLLQLLRVDNGDPDLYDVEEFKQQAAQMQQQAQMQQLQAMAAQNPQAAQALQGLTAGAGAQPQPQQPPMNGNGNGAPMAPGGMGR